ncbi:MAG: LAGLIDADG family homing endonuclease [Patescibacteria group bacterium]
MERAKFEKGKQEKFFLDVRNYTRLNWSKLAENCNVHKRTMNEWARGKQLPPFLIVKKLAYLSNKKIPKVTKLKNYWYTRKAGRIGGRKNVEINGNPGTNEGRRKGGLHSIEVNRKLNNDFFKQKAIKKPRQSKKLAELIGIILGDGHVRNYRFGITLNKTTDLNYSKYVSKIIVELFDIKPKIYIRKNYIQIDLLGVQAINFLKKNGLVPGNKIKNQIDVPEWIKKSKQFSQRCLVGLVDTDGCVYSDNHKVGRKKYTSICIDFTNHSLPLLNFIKNFLISNNYKITGSRWSVKIRRKQDVKRYYETIGFSNKKHSNKIIDFFKNGEVV